MPDYQQNQSQSSSSSSSSSNSRSGGNSSSGNGNQANLEQIVVYLAQNNTKHEKDEIPETLAALKKADEVLLHATQGISDLISVTGEVNVDFADVRTVMSNRGAALMGTGEATGDDRAVDAAQQARAADVLTQDGALLAVLVALHLQDRAAVDDR